MNNDDVVGLVSRVGWGQAMFHAYIYVLVPLSLVSHTDLVALDLLKTQKSVGVIWR